MWEVNLFLLEALGIGSLLLKCPPAQLPILTFPREVHPVTSVGHKVIWTPSSKPARRRSLEPVSRVSLQVSGLSKLCQSPGNSDPLFLDPHMGMGMPIFRPLPNPTWTRQRSCSPANLVWRKAAGGHWPGDSDEEGGDDKEKQEGRLLRKLRGGGFLRRLTPIFWGSLGQNKGTENWGNVTQPLNKSNAKNVRGVGVIKRQGRLRSNLQPTLQQVLRVLMCR